MADFDIVIVGAGTAGCLLARRLVERQGATVAVVEAGPRYPAVALDPPWLGLRLHGPWTDVLRTVPQRHLDGRRIDCPVGRVVGGTSSINAMIHLPGSPAVFDAWAAAGCTGWSARDLAPCFAAAMGEGGPLTVVVPSSAAPFTEAVIAACEEDGLVREPWVTGDRAGVCGRFACFLRRGRRSGAARDGLGGATGGGRGAGGAAVFLRTRSPVRRVIIERDRARGVELQDGTRIGARREVVLSAGVYRSPLLLQRSGIGPRDLLERAGIAPVIDLQAVGENLQDHVRVPVVFSSGRPSPGHWTRWPAAALRYLLRRDGLLASNCCEAGAMLATTPGRAVPDVEILSHFQTAWAVDAVDLECILLDAPSRGVVQIDPAAPFATPVIDPRYLSADREVEMLAAGIERARSIARRPSLAAFALREEIIPGPDADLPAAIRRLGRTAYHPAGTCRMGADADAVVDPRLRVRGVEGLRVVDASVMPSLPGGHPSATVYAIAERAARLMEAG